MDVMAQTQEELQAQLNEQRKKELEDYNKFLAGTSVTSVDAATIGIEEIPDIIISNKNVIDNYKEKEEVSQITIHANQEIQKTKPPEEKWTDMDIGLKFQQGAAAQQNATVIYNSLTSENFDANKKTHIRKSLEEAAKNEKIENFNELLEFEKTLIKHPKAFARMLCEFEKNGTNIDSSNEINTRTLFSSLKTYQGQLGLIECCEALNARENENKLVQGVKDFFNKLSVVIANVMEAPFKGALKSARDSSEGVDGKSHVKGLATQITGTTLSK